MDLNIEQFNPTVAQLNQLVSLSQVIVEVDIDDKEQMKAVHDHRIILRDARTAIAKTGKVLREEAVAFSKAVIAKEKELIAIIEPEEERLKALENEVAEKKERARRMAILPQRLEKLIAIKDDVTFSELEVLSMSDEEFAFYYNRRVTAKNEADAAELRKREDAVKAEETRLAREKEMQEREEKARVEERERAARAEQIRKDNEAKEKLEAEEREARARIDKERRDAEEKARLESDNNYQDFLAQHGYDGSSAFWLVREGTEIKLYKQVGSYNDGVSH